MFVRLKHVGKVSEIGLLSSVATSRGRVSLAAAVGVGLTIAYGFFASDFLENRSTSVGLNILWITLQLLLVVVAGYVTGVAVGCYAFGDSWRRRMFLGEKPRLADGDEEIDIDELRDHSMGFFGIVGGSVVAVYVALMLATGSYITQYNEVGYFRTLLRSSVPADRVTALRALVDPINEDSATVVEVRLAIADAVEDDDPEVRAWAAWTAGQREVLVAQPALLSVALSSDQPTEVRVEALHALGRLRDPEAERRLIALLPGTTADPELAAAVATSLGLMGSEDAVPVLGALIGTTEALDPVLFWAIRRGRSTAARDGVVAAWRGAETVEERCAAAEALKMVSTVDDLAWLQEAFATSERGVTCEPVQREERRYDDEEPMEPIVYVAGEELRRKYLTSIFNIRPTSLPEYLAEIAWDPEESDAMKVYADNLYQAIRRAPPVEPRR